MKKVLIDRYAHVREDDPNLPALRRLATFLDSKGEAITAYRKYARSLALPRHLLTREEWCSLGYEITDEPPASYDPIPYESTIVLRDHQRAAFEALRDAGDGVLCLRCGGGKTVIALHLIAQMGLPTLIVTPTVLLEEQWAAAVKTFLGIQPDSLRVTRRTGSPIVTTTVQTMVTYSRRVRDGYWDAYGLVVFDEAHHMSAPTFQAVAGLVRGRRLGLTATPYRGDGLEALYLGHLGPILYKDDRMTNKPEVCFVYTDVFLEGGALEACKVSGQINKPRLLNHLLLRPDRLQMAARLIRWSTELRGRTLVVCDLVEQAHRLALELGLQPEQVVLTGGTPKKDRKLLLASSGLLIATAGVIKEGFDATDLDTLVITMPQSSPTFVVQVLGRVMRERRGKSVPLAVVMEDRLIPTVRRWAAAFRKTLKEHEIQFKTTTEQEFYDDYKSREASFTE